MPSRSTRSLVINHDVCLACGACVGVCFFNALYLANHHLRVENSACEGCRFCEKTCPVKALSLVEVEQTRGLS